MKDYLPSMQFKIRVIIIAVLFLLGFGIYKAVGYFRNRGMETKIPTKILVKDLVQKDTNENGIPDWEEALWGLDPNKDGPQNKEFIMAKRKTLAEENGPEISNNQPLSENETMSREFFAIIMSLEQTGNLDDDALKSVSEAIGQKIVATPIPDVYTKSMLTIKDSDDSYGVINYYTDYVNLNNKYAGKNMGDELSFVATALRDNDPGALQIAGTVALAYSSFGKELIKIPVPSNLASISLDLANNYEKVAQSIYGLTHLLSEPITGMKALINYKKYSDIIADDIDKLTDNFN